MIQTQGSALLQSIEPDLVQKEVKVQGKKGKSSQELKSYFNCIELNQKSVGKTPKEENLKEEFQAIKVTHFSKIP